MGPNFSGEFRVGSRLEKSLKPDDQGFAASWHAESPTTQGSLAHPLLLSLTLYFWVRIESGLDSETQSKVYGSRHTVKFQTSA
jgi:hypothetical protein